MIVYSPTISKVEETVDFLGDQGIAAVPYHAKMHGRANGAATRSAGCRTKCACLWARSRSGWALTKRPCAPSSILLCRNRWSSFIRRRDAPGATEIRPTAFLLWRKQDAGLLGFFANQILDAAERDRAWQRYHTIRGFAESAKVPPPADLHSFWRDSEVDFLRRCDVCGAAPDWLTEVMAPARVRRAGWARVPVEPELRRPLSLRLDQDLREYLREWRRMTAKEQGMPAYVVLHDSSLDEICRLQPTSIADLLEHHGDRRAQSGLIRAGFWRRCGDIAKARARPRCRRRRQLQRWRLCNYWRKERVLKTLRGFADDKLERWSMPSPDW